MVWNTSKFSFVAGDAKEKVNNEVAVDDPLTRRRGCWKGLGLAVVGICCLSLIEGLHGRYLSSILTTIERRFQFTSGEVGVLFSLADITILASIVFTTYFGSMIHKARTLSACALIYVIAHVMWSLPYFIYPRNDFRMQMTDANMTGGIALDRLCSSNSTSEQCGVEEVKSTSSNRGALGLMYAAEIIFGLGLAIPYSIGLTYVEENAAVHKSSFYGGLIMASHLSAGILAFLLGGAMLSIPENLQDNGLSQDDPDWIGAWWLGWLVQTVIAAPWIVIFLFMPSSFKEEKEIMQTYAEKDIKSTINNDYNADKAIEDQRPSKFSVIHIIKRFFVSIYGFLKTSEYLLVLAAVIFRSLGGGGGSYGNKYMEFMFNVSPSNASLIAIVGSVASALGGFTVVMVTSRWKIKMSGTVLLLVTAYTLEGLVNVIEIFIYCPSQNFSGEIINHQLFPQSSCNSGCSCSNATYDPVCSDNKAFVNPCFAGCTNGVEYEQFINYTSCGCSPAGFALSGLCDRGCQMLWPYVAVTALRRLIGAFGEAPYMLLIIRTVDPKQDRALAFAFAFIFYSVIASVPTPILYGYAFDWSCLWSTSSCGNVGACAVYDIDRMRYVITIPSATGSFVAVAIYIVLHRMVVRKGLDTRDEEHKMINNDAETNKGCKSEDNKVSITSNDPI